MDVFEKVKLYFHNLIPKGEQDIYTYKRIYSLTWPAFFELFLSSLFGVIDLIMVGRLGEELGPISMSAVGLTNQPFQLLITLFAAVNVGTTTLVAWNVGAGRRDKAANIARQAIMFNLLAGTLMGAAGYALSPYITAFMGQGFTGEERAAIEYATEYLRIICFGVTFQAVNMSITAAFRGCGQTKVPMIYNIGSNAVNVGLNYVLIFGKFGFPAYYVAGAAMATTASRVIATFIAMYFLFLWKKSPIRLSFKDKWRPELKTVSEIFRIGIPAAGEQLVIQTGLILYGKMVATLGVLSYSAHQIAINVNSMAFSISQAFQVSTTSLVGQSVGADDYERAEKITIFARRIARVVTAVVATGFIIFARQICAIYTTNTAVIDIAIPIFYFMALVQFMQSSQMSTAGALRGSGDTMYPLYATICGIWIFRIGVAAVFIFAFKWGLVGGWFAFFLDQCMRSFVVKRRFSSGKWKEMKAAKLKKAEEFNKRQKELDGRV